MSTEIYQIDINLLYVLLTINRKTSIIDVNSSTYFRRQLKDVKTYKLSLCMMYDLDDKGNICITVIDDNVTSHVLHANRDI